MVKIFHENSMRSVVLIPSRLESSRLPGKALLKIGGIPMVARVMLQASKCAEVDDVFVCTDNKEIAKCISDYGGKFLMTDSSHKNGTTRIAEAKSMLPNYDLYVDLQGDEPFIDPCHISSVIDCHNTHNPDIVLPLLPFFDSKPSNVKVVKDLSGRVLYLSRADIPYQKIRNMQFSKHLSIVSFSPKALDQYASLPESPLESIEGIELLRALENGMYIQTIELSGDSFSIDTLEDYQRALQQATND